LNYTRLKKLISQSKKNYTTNRLNSPAQIYRLNQFMIYILQDIFLIYVLLSVTHCLLILHACPIQLRSPDRTFLADIRPVLHIPGCLISLPSLPQYR